MVAVWLLGVAWGALARPPRVVPPGARGRPGALVAIHDPGGHALDAFHAALNRAARRKGQVRIAFYGASHTAADLWTGCAFGCRYCLPVAHSWARRFGGSAGRWGMAEASALVRSGDPLNLAGLAALGANAPTPIPPVFLSLMSDPYPVAEERAKVARWTIRELHRHGVGVRVLTKSGTRAVRDFAPDLPDGLGSHPDDAYGATLTFMDPDDSRRWEPRAAMPAERMEGLQEAHRRGLPTWASLTPVVDPAQALDIIRATAPYVGLYTIGAIEADDILGDSPPRPAAADFDWADFAREAADLCTSLDVPCFVRAAGVVGSDTTTAVAQMDRMMCAEMWRGVCEARKPRWKAASAEDRETFFATMGAARYRV